MKAVRSSKNCVSIASLAKFTINHKLAPPLSAFSEISCIMCYVLEPDWFFLLLVNIQGSLWKRYFTTSRGI